MSRMEPATVTRWLDLEERAYGFVEIDFNGEACYFKDTQLPKGYKPVKGDRVLVEVGIGSHNRLFALSVRLLND